MSGQIIGDTQGQSKGNNFGVLGVNDVNNLILEDKYSQQAGMQYLGSYDYLGSTFASGISLPTVANGGYIDPTNYRTHLVLVSGIRNSGPHNMNIVFQFRNSGNTGNTTGNYYSWGYETLQDSSDNNFIRENNASSYMRSMNTNLLNADDAQAVQQIYIYNIGQNTQYANIYSRTSLRSQYSVGRHRSYDQQGTLGNRTDLGGFRWGGYTTSTWNAKFCIYGIREK